MRCTVRPSPSVTVTRDGLSSTISANSGSIATETLRARALIFLSAILREGLEHGRPVEGRIGRHIVHAELRTFDRGWIFIADARSRIFGDARLDSGDVGDVELIAKLERGVDSSVAETTAGITLGLEAALDYVVAAAKLGERIERHLDAAVEGAEIAGHRIFERRRTRREAGATQRGGKD